MPSRFMISAIAAPSFMTLSPQWLVGSIPADLPTVGTGFYASVKLCRRAAWEVLICVARQLTALRRGRRRVAGVDLPVKAKARAVIRPRRARCAWLFGDRLNRSLTVFLNRQATNQIYSCPRIGAEEPLRRRQELWNAT